MAKRFTDTDKWKKPFIRGLQGAYKLLWIYLLDDCDHAGIWQVDIEVASLRLGEKLELSEALKSFGDKVVPFDGGEKWFIPAFIEFQYGSLNPGNRAHASVLSLLNKYQLLEKNKGHVSPLQGAMDMVKEKDKEQEKDKEGVQGDFLQPVTVEEKHLSDMTLKILTDFGFSETKNWNKLQQIASFLRVLKASGRLEYFTEQYKSYWAYKKMSGAAKQSLETFISDGWDRENWSQKLIEFQSTGQKEKAGKIEQVFTSVMSIQNPHR